MIQSKETAVTERKTDSSQLCERSIAMKGSETEFGYPVGHICTSFCHNCHLTPWSKLIKIYLMPGVLILAFLGKTKTNSG